MAAILETFDPALDRWLTPEEAASYLGVSVNTLKKWRSIGEGPPFSASLRRHPRYRQAKLFEHMNGSTAQNTTQAKTLRAQAREHALPSRSGPTRR